MNTRVAGAIVALAVSLAACGPTEPSAPAADDGAITIASFNFAESEVVAEIYAGALRSAGFDVNHVHGVGPREVVLPALELGLVEVVPEYSGSALSFLGGTPTSDPRSTAAALALIVDPRGIEALTPASAQSRNGLVVTDATARRLDLRTISDLDGSAATLSLGGPPECPDRRFCLPGFERTYGLTFESFRPLDVGGPLTADAVVRGTVDVGVLFTSDGHLVQHDLVLLKDDRHLQPAESIIPLVRSDAIDRFGGAVVEVLDGVSAELTTQGLQELNAEVASGVTVEDAAARWLGEHGLGRSSG